MSNKYNTSEEIASYGIGIQMGNQLLNNPFEGMNFEAVIQGLGDTLNKVESPIKEEQFKAAFAEISAKIEANKKSAFETVVAQGESFLAENKLREEVTETASGLQYLVVKEGDGDIPEATSTVVVHYTGTLLDGTVFDSSVQRGQPATFPVNGVIGGWTEALQLMKVGSSWKLFIPYHLAYGDQGAGGAIGPYSTLIFDVELLEIK
ncbi:MAG: FKBP-type peptidyl-prolyl cis-trans isomerase [Saprospiraceae bacterium]